MPEEVTLGLIGDNIGESRAPALHRLAGGLVGLDVAYALCIPAAHGLDFDGMFDECVVRGLNGVNVTLPYKERAVARVRIDDPLVRAIGAINTTVFDAAGPLGFNTDHSGFMAAYRSVRGDAPPGRVCLMGAGGVGKAIAFALAALGAEEIRLVDTDGPKAAALAKALGAERPALKLTAGRDAEAAARGADGLVNATPLGMSGYGGAPLGRAHMSGAGWAFDAVYTPRETTFLGDAAAAGLAVISGYELFFHQGIHAFRHFTGRDVDPAALRRALAATG